MTTEGKTIFVFVQTADDKAPFEGLTAVFNKVLKEHHSQVIYPDVFPDMLEKEVFYRGRQSEGQGKRMSSMPVLIAAFNKSDNAFSFLKAISRALSEEGMKEIDTGILYNKPL